MAEEIVNQETELLSDADPIIETTPEAINDGEIKGFKQKSKTYVSKDGQKKYNIPLDKEDYFLSKVSDVEEAMGFEANGTKYAIPKSKAYEFLKKNPNAVSLDYTEEKPQATQQPLPTFQDNKQTFAPEQPQTEIKEPRKKTESEIKNSFNLPEDGSIFAKPSSIYENINTTFQTPDGRTINLWDDKFGVSITTADGVTRPFNINEDMQSVPADQKGNLMRFIGIQQNVVKQANERNKVYYQKLANEGSMTDEDKIQYAKIFGSQYLNNTKGDAYTNLQQSYTDLQKSLPYYVEKGLDTAWDEQKQKQFIQQIQEQDAIRGREVYPNPFDLRTTYETSRGRIRNNVEEYKKLHENLKVKKAEAENEIKTLKAEHRKWGNMPLDTKGRDAKMIEINNKLMQAYSKVESITYTRGSISKSIMDIENYINKPTEEGANAVWHELKNMDLSNMLLVGFATPLRDVPTLQIAKKKASGVPLSEDEEFALELYKLDKMVKSSLQQTSSGNITSNLFETVPYMFNLALTRGSGTVLKAGVEKYLSKYVSSNLLNKAIGTTLMATYQGALMGNTYGDAVEATINNPETSVWVNVLKEIPQSTMTAFVEIKSIDLLKSIAKIPTADIGKMFAQSTRTTIGGKIDDIFSTLFQGSSELKILHKLFEEFGEEKVEEFLNILFFDEGSWGNFVSLRSNLETFAVVALIQGAGKINKKGIQGVDVLNSRKEYLKTMSQLPEQFKSSLITAMNQTTPQAQQEAFSKIPLEQVTNIEDRRKIVDFLNAKYSYDFTKGALQGKQQLEVAEGTVQQAMNYAQNIENADGNIVVISDKETGNKYISKSFNAETGMHIGIPYDGSEIVPLSETKVDVLETIPTIEFAQGIVQNKLEEVKLAQQQQEAVQDMEDVQMASDVMQQQGGSYDVGDQVTINGKQATITGVNDGRGNFMVTIETPDGIGESVIANQAMFDSEVNEQPLQETPTMSETETVENQEQSQEVAPSGDNADIEAKKADIERRKQEELDKRTKTKEEKYGWKKKSEGIGIEKLSLIGKQYDNGMKVTANFSPTPDGYKDGEYKVIIRQREPQINKTYSQEDIDKLEKIIISESNLIEYRDKDAGMTFSEKEKPKIGDTIMIKSATVEVSSFESKEEAEQYLKDNEEKLIKTRHKISDQINAKYDAELKALEQTQQEAVQDSETETTEQTQPTPEIPRLKDGSLDYDTMSGEMLATELPKALGATKARSIINAQIKARNTELKNADKKVSKSITEEVKQEAKRQTIREEIKRLETALMGLTKSNVPMMQKREQPKQKVVSDSIQQISDVYQSSPKVYGRSKQMTLPNGEKVKGKFVLIEAGTAVPSHDPFTFAKTKGFPTTETGTTVNDRDYENDEKAQQEVIMQSQNPDDRAYVNPVMVTPQGIVVSGTQRTILVIRAYKQGTNVGYTTPLREDIDMYGISQEQFDGFNNPQLVFELDETPDYTTATFAKFNTEDKKSQSTTESAVKVSKTIKPDTISKIGDILDKHETLGDFYSANQDIAEVLTILQTDGVIRGNDIARLVKSDGVGLSDSGKEFFETLMIGAVLNESAIRQIDVEGMRNVKQKIVKAIVPIVNNAKLKEYNLIAEISEAINIVEQARKNKLSVANFISNGTIFDKNNYSDAGVFFAVLLDNSKESQFRNAIVNYNANAILPESGQVDIFSGDVTTKEQIVETLIQNTDAETKQSTEKAWNAVKQNRDANDFFARGTTTAGSTDIAETPTVTEATSEVKESVSPEKVITPTTEEVKQAKEQARIEKRKQRILSEGTGYDKEFGLIPVSEIKTASDIQSNVEKIITTLKENEGNKKFNSFEGYSNQGKNYAKNAGEQIRGYFIALDVLPIELQKEFAKNINVSTPQDIINWGEKKYKEVKLDVGNTDSSQEQVSLINPERENDHEALKGWRESVLPDINNNPDIINLNAFVDKVRKLDPKDTMDKYQIDNGFNYEITISFPHSLGEQGTYTEYYYPEYPTVSEIKKDLLEDYPIQIKKLQGKELPYGGYAMGAKNENIVNELKKALEYNKPTPTQSISPTPETPTETKQRQKEVVADALGIESQRITEVETMLNELSDKTKKQAKTTVIRSNADAVVQMKKDGVDAEFIEAFQEVVANGHKPEAIMTSHGLYIVSSNIKDTQRAVEVWFHEQAGHYGIRLIMPDTAQRKAFFTDIYNSVGEANIREALGDGYAKVTKPEVLGEEYFGRVCEKVVRQTSLNELEQGVWDSFLNKLREFISNLLPSAKLSQGQIESIAKASIQNIIEVRQKTDIQARQKTAEIEAKADNVNTNPTEAQKKAGNYAKAKVSIQGLQITIENPKGSVRSGTDREGNEWFVEMNNDYGYFNGTKAKDWNKKLSKPDEIDVFIGDNPTSKKVFVVDQVDTETREFDESKVMLGFDTIEDAELNYLLNYEAGWQGLGKITEVDMDTFKTWLNDGKRQLKPFGEYKEIRKETLFSIAPESIEDKLSRLTPLQRKQAENSISGINKQIDENQTAIANLQKEIDKKRKSIDSRIMEATQTSMFDEPTKDDYVSTIADVFAPDLSEQRRAEVLKPMQKQLQALQTQYNDLVKQRRDKVNQAITQAKSQLEMDFGEPNITYLNNQVQEKGVFDLDTGIGQMDMFASYKEGSYDGKKLDVTYMERMLSKQKGMTFMGEKLTGVVKIKSANDVAFLFKNLESASSENAFAVLHKNNGDYKVLYLGTGGTTSTVIDIKPIIATMDDYDSVTLVHNHPSGNLDASDADRNIHRRLELAMLGIGKKSNMSIIINLDSGKYTIFTGSDISSEKKKDVKGKIKDVDIYSFDRQKLYVPSAEKPLLNNAQKTAEYLSKMKRGSIPKIITLVLDNKLALNRAVMFDESITQEELVSNLLKEVSKHGEHIILASNKKLNKELIEQYLGKIGSNLLDVVTIKQDSEITKSEQDIMFSIAPNFKNPRNGLTKVKGGWTKAKIIKELKEIKKVNRNYGQFGLLSTIASFKDADDLRNHLFYHGTGGGVSGALYPSITVSEREAQQSGGGGYGERYFAVSVSQSKRKASNFSGMSRGVSVYPVILNPQAKVIDRPDLSDSIELEDIIEELWNDNVDAVRLGDWKDDSSEQELAILNPLAISTWSNSDYSAVYQMDRNKFAEKTDEELETIIDKSKQAIIKLNEWRDENKRPLMPDMIEYDFEKDDIETVRETQLKNKEIIQQRKKIREKYTSLENAEKRRLTDDIKFSISPTKEYKPIPKPYYDKLLTRLNKAFPNISISTDTAEMERVLNAVEGVQKLTTPTGELYGMTHKGKIYLDGNKMNANAPIHEYGHIWADIAKKQYREVYNHGLELIRGTEYETEVRNSGSYKDLKDEEQILNEALITAIGDRGERIVDKAIRNKFTAWLKDLFNNIRMRLGINRVADLSKFDLSKMDLSEFVKRVNLDLLGGVPISYMSSSDVAKRDENKLIVGIKGATRLDEINEATTRLDNLKVAEEMERGKSDIKNIDNEISASIKELESKYSVDLWFYYSKNSDAIILSKIIVPKKEREKGVGTSVMNEITSIADKYGVKIGLTPANDFGGSVTRLKQFYKKFGFKPYRGYDMKESLSRDPITPKQFSPTEIRLATGWERGADNKWRYEVEDIGMNLSRIERIGMYSNDFIIKLSDLYNDKQLYNAYPELENIRVLFDGTKQMGNGAFRKSTNEILIDGNVEEINPKRNINEFYQLNSTLIHEIQHAIQAIEGFAKGGNVNDIGLRNKLSEAGVTTISELQEKIKTLKKEYGKIYHEWSNKAFFSGRYKGQKTETSNLLREWQKIEADIKKLEDNTYDFQKAFKDYQRLAGEVEARNTETRMNFTPEQRILQTLASTEDISRADQIIIHDTVSDTPMFSIAPKELQADTKMVTRTKDIVREVTQDSLLSVKMLQDYVVSKGGTLTNATDTKSAVERYSSKVNGRFRIFNMQVLRPLTKFIADIEKRYKLDSYATRDYLLAKASLARHNAGTDALSEDLNDEWNIEAVKKIITDYEIMVDASDIAELWDKTNAVNDFSTKALKDAGILTKEQYDAIKAKWDYYVPLRGWDLPDEVNKQIKLYTEMDKQGVARSGDTTYSEALKKAKGRKSKAYDPISTMSNIAYSSLITAEKNIAEQHMLNFIRQNKDFIEDVAFVKRTWIVESEDGTKSEEVIERPDQSLFDAGRVKNKRNKDTREFSKYVTPQSQQAKQIEVYENGIKYVIEFKQSGVAEAITGNNMYKMPKFWDVVMGKPTRFLSKNLTGLNPDFIPVNFVRDFGYAMLANYVNANSKISNIGIINEMGQASKAIKAFSWTDNFDETNPLHKDFINFINSGGATGYMNIQKLEKVKKQIDRDLKVLAGSESKFEKSKRYAKAPFAQATRAIGFLGEMSELTMRYAVYRAGIKAGVSVNESVDMAKNITVNFNRKGRISGVLGGLYAFYGASIQGGNNFVTLAYQNKGKMAKVALSFMAMGALWNVAMTMLMGGNPDDDESYYNVNEFSRYNNLIIPTGGKTYIKIPLPHVFRSFFAMGQIGVEMMTGHKTFGQGLLGSMDAMLDGLSPVNLDLMSLEGDYAGSTFIRTLLPTTIQPMFDLGFNRNFFGQSITKESFDESTPSSQLGKTSVSPILRTMAETFNSATGGDEFDSGWADFNPSAVEYLLESYTGGRGRFYMNLLKIAQSSVDANIVLETRNIPLANRFVGENYGKNWGAELKEITKTIKDDNDLMRKYYKNMDSSKDYKQKYEAIAEKYNNDIVWTRATSRNQSTPNLKAIKILDAHNKEVRTIYDDINASSSQKNRNQLYEVIRKISKETVKELRVYKIK